MNIITTTISVLTVMGGLAGVASLLYVRPTRRKLVNEAQKAGAEASQLMVSGAITLLQPLQDRVKELESRLKQADRDATELRCTLERERQASSARIEDLERQVRERDQIIIQFQRRMANGNHPGGDS